MLLIGTEVLPFNATAYHNGAFVDVSDADLDMMFRLQQEMSGEDRRFVRSQDAFGHSGTATIDEALRATRRRQRAVLQMTASWAPGAAQ